MKPLVVKLITGAIMLSLMLLPFIDHQRNQRMHINQQLKKFLLEKDFIEEVTESTRKRVLADPSYTNTFAPFTDHYKVLDSPQSSYTGTWIDRSATPRSTALSGFENHRGETNLRFEFIPEISKTWLHLEIKDEKYLDSSRASFAINLKMAHFDKANSTFISRCNQGDEYYAVAFITEHVYTQKQYMYFDIDFKMWFMDKTTRAPLDMNIYKPQDVLIGYTLQSIALGINIDATTELSATPPPSKFKNFIIILLACLLLFWTFSMNDKFSQDFILNMGFEALAIIVLFFYHLFCAFIQLAKMSPQYDTVFYVLAGVSFLSSFLFNIEMLHYLMVEAQVRRVHGDIFYCLCFMLYISILIMIGIFTPSIIFHQSYKIFLSCFFVFPILQVLFTLKKANNYRVFNPGYQIFNWWPTFIYAMFMKGVHNDIVNLTPWTPLCYISTITVISCGLIMYLQSKLGVYFFIPKSWISGYYDMVTPVSKVPLDKLADECPICYVGLKYDPEAFQVDGGGMREMEVQPPVVVPENQREVPGDNARPNSNANQRRGEDEALLVQVAELMKTPCNHYFHVVCLKRWLRTRQSCPICNSRVVLYE